MKLRRAKTVGSSKPIALPGRSASVILTTPSGEKFPARVLERGMNTLLVAITVPVKALSERDLQGLVLEYVANGRVRLHGSARIENPAEPDVLRIDEPRSIEVLQEREYVRIKAARPVLVYAGADHPQVQSYTVDLSGGGFLLAGPDTLKIGEEVSFQLTIASGAPPVTGKGKVVRTDAQGGERSPSTTSAISTSAAVRFIFEAQRVELRRGLEQGDSRGG